MKFKGEVEITFPSPVIHHLDEFEAKDEWDAQMKALRMLRRRCNDAKPAETRLLLFEVVKEQEKLIVDVERDQLALF